MYLNPLRWARESGASQTGASWTGEQVPWSRALPVSWWTRRSEADRAPTFRGLGHQCAPGSVARGSRGFPAPLRPRYDAGRRYEFAAVHYLLTMIIQILSAPAPRHGLGCGRVLGWAVTMRRMRAGEFIRRAGTDCPRRREG